ncbi:hypothetical protein ACFW93_34430 [Streptomyces canus]|uniref:hypothetical protein n=1 Tax=Streptomyces canus TaxID=58343 RepID=UPI0036BBBAC9
MAASSWPASLVAEAAEAQGAEVADRVLRRLRRLRRLRESVFVLGEPADAPALAVSAASADVLERVRADHAEARRPVGEVLSVHGCESPRRCGP